MEQWKRLLYRRNLTPGELKKIPARSNENSLAVWNYYSRVWGIGKEEIVEGTPYTFEEYVNPKNWEDAYHARITDRNILWQLEGTAVHREPFKAGKTFFDAKPTILRAFLRLLPIERIVREATRTNEKFNNETRLELVHMERGRAVLKNTPFPYFREIALGHECSFFMGVMDAAFLPPGMGRGVRFFLTIRRRRKTMCDAVGRVLEGITGPLAGFKPKHVVVFIIDGCRADALYGALESGQMPHLKKLMKEAGHRRYEACITVFPSVTVACHASIVTGAYPGLHGIVGNNWFIRKKWAEGDGSVELYRATREYVKYSWKHPKSDPGLMNGFLTDAYFSIANADLSHRVRTAYEACNASPRGGGSLSVLEMVSRGAREREYIDFDDVSVVRGRIFDFVNRLWGRIRGRDVIRFPTNPIDSRAFDNLVAAFSRPDKHEWPEMSVVWLPGMDGFSHANGAKKQPAYFKRRNRFVEWWIGSVDRQFGRFHRVLRKRRRLDDVLLVVTADHGQYDCRARHTVSVRDVYRRLAADPACADETFPLSSSGDVDENCTDASVVASQNGGCLYLYVRGEGGWRDLPGPGRLEKFAAALARMESTDKVFVRDGSRYLLWEAGGFVPVETLDSREYPLAAERVNTLSLTARSGDVVVSARRPAYYEGKPLRGEHGSLHREDGTVPLLFIGGGLDGTILPGDGVRVIDILPTVARLMGYEEALKRPGTRREKLAYILDALEQRARSSLARGGVGAVLSRLGRRLDASRVERDWDVEREDMCRNFEAKLEAYRRDGVVSEEEYAALLDRYGRITGDAG